MYYLRIFLDKPNSQIFLLRVTKFVSNESELGYRVEAVREFTKIKEVE